MADCSSVEGALVPQQGIHFVTSSLLHAGMQTSLEKLQLWPSGWQWSFLALPGPSWSTVVGQGSQGGWESTQSVRKPGAHLQAMGLGPWCTASAGKELQSRLAVAGRRVRRDLRCWKPARCSSRPRMHDNLCRRFMVRWTPERSLPVSPRCKLCRVNIAPPP